MRKPLTSMKRYKFVHLLKHVLRRNPSFFFRIYSASAQNRVNPLWVKLHPVHRPRRTNLAESNPSPLNGRTFSKIHSRVPYSCIWSWHKQNMEGIFILRFHHSLNQAKKDSCSSKVHRRLFAKYDSSTVHSLCSSSPNENSLASKKKESCPSINIHKRRQVCPPLKFGFQIFTLAKRIHNRSKTGLSQSAGKQWQWVSTQSLWFQCTNKQPHPVSTQSSFLSAHIIISIYGQLLHRFCLSSFLPLGNVLLAKTTFKRVNKKSSLMQ